MIGEETYGSLCSAADSHSSLSDPAMPVSAVWKPPHLTHPTATHSLLVTVLADRQLWSNAMGEATARRLADLHERMTRSLIKKHGGRQTRRGRLEADPGEGLHAVFEQPDEAMDFAVAYLRSQEQFATGEEGYSGVGMQVGAGAKLRLGVTRRLAAMARGRRILMTADAFDAVYHLLKNAVQLSFRALPGCAVEGMSEPIDLVEVRSL